jgi:hypothetical protein
VKSGVALLIALSALLVAVPWADAQTATRRLSTIDALRRFPGYYHLQNVLIRGEFAEAGVRPQLRADERVIDVILADGVRTISGMAEVRAQFIDVGRLEPGDPRLTGYSVGRETERWPRPGEELLLAITGVVPADPITVVSTRALALEPWRYEGQTITLVGQFRGRNLFGDLPGAPAKSRFDFVLRSGDGAVWITGLRPRGRGFDLNVDARVDTGRWLEVTGVVKRERSLVTLEAAKLTTTTARTETVPEEPAVPPAPPSPIEVVFSSPTQDETDVSTAAGVRIQFSRGLNPSSLASGFSVSYVGGQATPPIEFRTSYDFATRAVEIRFPEALAPFRMVRIETRADLKGFDGASVTPWTLTFGAGS